MKMNTIQRICAIVAIVLLSVTSVSLAMKPPERINLQGVLRDNTGAPVDGAQNMSFHLYDSAAGCPGTGTLLLSDDLGAVTVSDGLFNAVLGSGTVTPGTAGGLAEEFHDNPEVWVEIDVGVETLCPRVRVESAPYAQMAGGLVTDGSVGIGTASPV